MVYPTVTYDLCQRHSVGMVLGGIVALARGSGMAELIEKLEWLELPFRRQWMHSL